MDGSKFSESDMNSNRLWVLRIVLSGLEFCAIWIGFAGAGKGSLDGFTGRRHHKRVETGKTDLVTGFGHRMFCLVVKLRICVLQKGIGCGSRLSVWPVVDELTDRDSLRQFSHSAEVIAMPMRRYQMINLLQLGILCGCNDAIGIARSGGTGIAGVNEERLALRGHQEGRIPAFHV